MMVRCRQFLSVSGLTAVEVLRQPTCLLLAATCIVLISLLPLVITHTLGDPGKLIRDSAMASQFLAGLFLGGYAACSTLSHEIRRGTAASILSKPVGREIFFLAKYTGVAVVMTLFSGACLLATIMSTRVVAEPFVTDWWAATPLLLATPLAFLIAGMVNFFTRRPFTSVAFGWLLVMLSAGFLVSGFFDQGGQVTAFGALFSFRLVPACTLIGMATLLLTAVAVSLATRLEAIPTICICTLMFLLGLMSDYLFGRAAELSTWASMAYTLIPNWQHFWVVDALQGEAGIPWSYVAATGRYAAWYLAGILGFGLSAFLVMDVKA